MGTANKQDEHRWADEAEALAPAKGAAGNHSLAHGALRVQRVVCTYSLIPRQ